MRITASTQPYSPPSSSLHPHPNAGVNADQLLQAGRTLMRSLESGTALKAAAFAGRHERGFWRVGYHLPRERGVERASAMHADISDLSARLSGRTEDFCRAYLGNGQRKGAYWVVGDARGAPGRSLYVKISGPRTGLGAIGRWCDAATGEHGDLLDLLALNQAHNSMTETLAEARRFLSDMGPIKTKRCDAYRNIEQRRIAAQRLFAASIPYEGTPAQIYFATRYLIAGA